MRAVLLLGLFLALATTGAEARPDTRQMTCGEVNAAIQDAGSLVMTTGRNTYQRFVANRNWCDPWELTKPQYAPSADQARCVVRAVCWEPPWTNSDNFGLRD